MGKYIKIILVVLVIILGGVIYFVYLKERPITYLEFQLVPMNWEEVDPKWEAFAQEHLEKMRQIDAETARAKRPGYVFDREFIEVKSLLIAKFLPGFHIYREQSSKGQLHHVFALSPNGGITDIGNGWSGRGDEPYYRNPKYSDFISSRAIQIMDEQTAIEVIKLTEDIFHRIAVKELDWKYKASRTTDIWIVKKRYVGDPTVSIVEPPVWEIVVDEQNKIKEIRQQREEL